MGKDYRPTAPDERPTMPASQTPRKTGRRAARRSFVCPQCGSGEVAPIAYGYPSDMDAYLKAIDEGAIVGGGCVIEADAPAWRCRACGHGWGQA